MYLFVASRAYLSPRQGSSLARSILQERIHQNDRHAGHNGHRSPNRGQGDLIRAAFRACKLACIVVARIQRGVRILEYFHQLILQSAKLTV